LRSGDFVFLREAFKGAKPGTVFVFLDSTHVLWKEVAAIAGEEWFTSRFPYHYRCHNGLILWKKSPPPYNSGGGAGGGAGGLAGGVVVGGGGGAGGGGGGGGSGGGGGGDGDSGVCVEGRRPNATVPRHLREGVSTKASDRGQAFSDQVDHDSAAYWRRQARVKAGKGGKNKSTGMSKYERNKGKGKGKGKSGGGLGREYLSDEGDTAQWYFEAAAAAAAGRR
jgi:hypothetical protein